MLRETEAIAHRNLDFLPLKSYDGIVEGNALRIDWEKLLAGLQDSQDLQDRNPYNPGNPAILSKKDFDYIVGNPQFSGARWMGTEQKKDVLDVFGSGWPSVGDLDYVCCWFKKAADYMAVHTFSRSAFVATNSISQGAAPENLWKGLFAQGVTSRTSRTLREDKPENCTRVENDAFAWRAATVLG